MPLVAQGNLIMKNIMDRFWKYVDKQDDHWIWTGAKSGNFGRMKINGAVVRVTRVSYVYHYGKIPETCMIDHKCWETLCVNPEHLEMRREISWSDMEELGTEKAHELVDIRVKKGQKPNYKPHELESDQVLWFRSWELPKDFYKKVTLSPNEQRVT